MSNSFGNITFIDGGSNRGQIFRWCFDRNMQVKYDEISHSQFFYPKDFRNATFYLFEPTIRLNKYLTKIKNTKPCRIEIINKALWTKDTNLNLYLCQEKKWRTNEADESIGNTVFTNLFSDKIDKERPLKVKAINTVNWIKKHIDKKDYVILKLDVEGAEIPILDALIKYNLLNTHINELHVEWHDYPRIPKLKYTENKKENWTITENYYLPKILRSKVYYKRWQM